MLSMNKIVSFLLIFLFVSGLFIYAFNPVSASELIEDSWNTKASMHIPRDNLGVVAFDGKIYAIGGINGYDYTNIVERYEPKTDKWVILESMPTSRANFAIAAYDGKIYCIGGSAPGYFVILSDPLNVNEVYDIATDSWSAKKSAPFRGMSQAHVVNGKIFVMSIHGELYMYDPITDVWINKTFIPAGVDLMMGSAVIDDKILFAHTIETSEKVFRSTKIYDTKKDEWQEVSISENGGFYASGKTGATTGVYAPQRIYVMGCRLQDTTVYNYVYNPLEDTSTFAKEAPTFRRDFGVAVVDDILYVIGGQETDASYSVTHRSLSLNQQYVPIGYKGAVSAPKPSTPEQSKPTTSEPTPSRPYSTYLIVATLTITTITIATSLLFYFRKRKRGITGDVSIFDLSKPLT